MAIRKTWPARLSGAASSASITRPVPSIAGWRAVSARTANTASAGAAMVMLASSFSSVMRWGPVRRPELTGRDRLRPLEHEVEVLAPGRPVIVGRLPATRDPVRPDVGDEPLEHVGVLAEQSPPRAVERHGEDPTDTSFIVVEGRVGVADVAATEDQDHTTRGLSDVALHGPSEDHERLVEPLDRGRARHLPVGRLQEPRVAHRRPPRSDQNVQLVHGLVAHRFLRDVDAGSVPAGQWTPRPRDTAHVRRPARTGTGRPTAQEPSRTPPAPRSVRAATPVSSRAARARRRASAGADRCRTPATPAPS